MLQLNRRKIYSALIALLLLAHFFPCFYFLIGSETTEGKIVDVKIWTSGSRKAKRKHVVPIAQIEVNHTRYTILGPDYPDLAMADDIGDVVPIVYKKSNPKNAYFYTLTGFWFSNYINWLVVILLITCAVFSFIDSSQLLIFRYNTTLEGKTIELTKSVKSKSLLARLQRAKEAMRRKPRR